MNLAQWVKELENVYMWILPFRRWPIASAILIEPASLPTPVYGIGSATMIDILGVTKHRTVRLYVSAPIVVPGDLSWAIFTSSSHVLQARYTGGSQTFDPTGSWFFGRFTVVKSRPARRRANKASMSIGVTTASPGASGNGDMGATW